MIKSLRSLFSNLTSNPMGWRTDAAERLTLRGPERLTVKMKQAMPFAQDLPKGDFAPENQLLPTTNVEALAIFGKFK